MQKTDFAPAGNSLSTKICHYERKFDCKKQHIAGTLTTNTITVSVKTLAAGIYYVMVKNSTSIITQEFIKK